MWFAFIFKCFTPEWSSHFSVIFQKKEKRKYSRTKMREGEERKEGFSLPPLASPLLFFWLSLHFHAPDTSSLSILTSSFLDVKGFWWSYRLHLGWVHSRFLGRTLWGMTMRWENFVPSLLWTMKAQLLKHRTSTFWGLLCNSVCKQRQSLHWYPNAPSKCFLHWAKPLHMQKTYFARFLIRKFNLWIFPMPLNIPRHESIERKHHHRNFKIPCKSATQRLFFVMF